MSHRSSEIEQLRAYYSAVLPYYDLSLEDRGDLPFWTSIARRWGSKRILELGCGTGRVTSAVCEIASTTAVDLLIEMLQPARRRAPRAHFVVADLCELALTSAFDLVLLADDPMAHLTSSDERMKAMKGIADQLTADGRLVIEGLYRPPMKAPPRDIVRDGKTLFTVDESWEPAGENALWNAAYRYTMGSTITEVTSVPRSWTREEISRLPECSLQVEALWGDFDESPFSGATSSVVIVARRSA